MDALSGKRFLITQPFLNVFCGSAIVTMELAEYLKSNGGIVEVYTYTYADPMKSEFEKRKIKVITTEDNYDFNLANYDYIWIHSNVLPEDLVKQLVDIEALRHIPYFIFLHMSPHDFAPDEAPWIYQFEEKLADKILFVSDETRDKHVKILGDKINMGYYRNPSPLDYMVESGHREHLGKVLIVSNHVPSEVKKAAEILQARGVTVDHLGERGNKQELVQPDLLAQYDAVITIGKTVQYCLLAHKPVYIYDSFGGPGYLTKNNFDKAKHYNFSGRGFNKKDPQEIAEELISGWQGYSDKDFELDDFRIDKVLADVFDNLQKRPKCNLRLDHVLATCHAQRLAQFRFMEHYWNIAHRDEIAYLKKGIRSLEKEVQSLKRDLNDKKQEIHQITSAKSYKLMVKLLKPLNKLRGKSKDR